MKQRQGPPSGILGSAQTAFLPAQAIDTARVGRRSLSEPLAQPTKLPLLSRYLLLQASWLILLLLKWLLHAHTRTDP